MDQAVLTDGNLQIERLRVAAALRWKDVKAGLQSDSIQADLLLQVCGKEVRFPGIHYGFDFEPGNGFSLKALLQAIAALDADPDAYWRVASGGAPKALLSLSLDPAERFEALVFDDHHLYIAYHTNRGGALAVDALLSVEGLIEAEERATEQLKTLLDEREADSKLSEWRSRYLGRWEHLKSRVRRLNGRLTCNLPSTEPPLF